MIKGLTRVFSLLIGLAAVIWLAQYVLSQPETWALLGQAEVGVITALVVVLFISKLANGLVIRDLAFHFGIRLKVREWVGLTFVTSLLNLIFPLRGGAVFRAVYLKSYHGLLYTRFISLQAAAVIYALLINALLAGGVLILMGVPGGSSGILTLLACCALVIGIGLGMRFAPAGDLLPSRLAKIGVAVEGWRTISRDQTLRWKLLGSVSLNALGSAIAYILAFRVAGWSGIPGVPIVSSAFAKIGALIALTPGGLGISEAFGVVSTHLIGEDASVAALAVLVVRALSIVIVGVAGLLSWRLLGVHRRELHDEKKTVGAESR